MAGISIDGRAAALNRMRFQQRAPSLLCFPGEETRETWSCGTDGVWQRVDPAAGGLLGIESIAFDSAPFWSFATDEQDQAVALRWEGFGLFSEAGARLWTHWPAARKGKQVLVGTLALVLDSPLPDAECYEPSATMLPLPDCGVAIWRELGRYVVAFTRDAALLHVAVLASCRLDVDAAFEVHNLSLALQAQALVHELPVIHLWTACENGFVPQLACLFDSSGIINEPRPNPRPPGKSSGLIPAHVAARRQKQLLRRRQWSGLAVAALMYLGFFVTWFLRLEWRESQLSRGDSLAVEIQPVIDRVREAQALWQDMETAINPDLYPMELFHQIVSLLPAEGIRLKEFQIDGSRLVLSGEATTVNLALGFKDRLAACEPLQRYAWSFPVPAIREDNRADFRAEGTLTGGPANEGQ